MNAHASKLDNPIFVHSKLDELGLSAAEFRIVGHIARRGDCLGALSTIAKICRLHRDTVITAINSLVIRGIVRKETRRGQTSVLRVNPISAWEPVGNEGAGLVETKGQPETNGHPFKPHTTQRKRRGNHPEETEGHKGNPSEGDPSEGNPKVAVRREFPECLRTQKVLSAWEKWESHRRALKKPKSWDDMFNSQIEWLSHFDEAKVVEILSFSTRNGYQGIFPPKHPSKQTPGKNGSDNATALLTPHEVTQSIDPRQFQN